MARQIAAVEYLRGTAADREPATMQPHHDWAPPDVTVAHTGRIDIQCEAILAVMKFGVVPGEHRQFVADGLLGTGGTEGQRIAHPDPGLDRLRRAEAITACSRCAVMDAAKTVDAVACEAAQSARGSCDNGFSHILRCGFIHRAPSRTDHRFAPSSAARLATHDQNGRKA